MRCSTTYIPVGNNRDATFFAEQDYQFYLECLYDASIRYGVDIHAYVLMTNHVHLLMTPELETSMFSHAVDWSSICAVH